jgi:hypothetical protein
MALDARLERDAMRALISRLADSFGDTHSAEQISSTVDSLYHRFDGSRVRSYIPLLVEHGAREQLRSRTR